MPGAGGSGATIENTECVAPAAPSVEIYPASDFMLLDELAAVGNRFTAGGESGVVYFDADGSNADTTPAVAFTHNAVIAETSTVGVAWVDAGRTNLQRFDELGAPVSVQAGVEAVDPKAMTLATADDFTTIVWAFNTGLFARTLTSQSAWQGDVFSVATAAFGTFIRLEAATDSDRKTAVVWTGSPGGARITSVVTVSAARQPGEPIVLSQDAEHVAGVAATEDGFVVLVTMPPPTNDAVILKLDGEGNPIGDAVMLEGAQYAYDLASQGDSFAVVVGRETGEPQLRVFDLAVEPLGPWVCLGADHQAVTEPAVTRDGDGYATIHTTAQGAVMLTRLDGIGTGAP